MCLEECLVSNLGLDNVDVDHCKEKGVILTHAPGYNANAIAGATIATYLTCIFIHRSWLLLVSFSSEIEIAVMHMIAACRNIPRALENVQLRKLGK
jgi:lactate dehydrogenase-like 2-hydroxyacid dehydrogenase